MDTGDGCHVTAPAVPSNHMSFKAWAGLLPGSLEQDLYAFVCMCAFTLIFESKGSTCQKRLLKGEDMFEQWFIHIFVDQETEKGCLLASSFLP